MLRIALTKGRIEKQAIALFKQAGYDCEELENKGRKLLLTLTGSDIEVVLVKSADVLTYVEHGVCDLGIVGEDTIAEYGGAFYEILDLEFGKCRFVLAGPAGKDFYDGYSHKIIATKYPNVAKNYFNAQGLDVEIVKIEGSVELAPILGLSDGIVDIVETGTTLRENGLEVYEEISDISARLIVNVVSIKLKKTSINVFVNNMIAAIGREKDTK